MGTPLVVTRYSYFIINLQYETCGEDPWRSPGFGHKVVTVKYKERNVVSATNGAVPESEPKLKHFEESESPVPIFS